MRRGICDICTGVVDLDAVECERVASVGGQVGVYGPLTHNVARGPADSCDTTAVEEDKWRDIGDITTGAGDTLE